MRETMNATELKNKLVNSDFGLEADYSGEYTAYATESIGDEGGWVISYHKGAMPAHDADNFANSGECAAKMLEISAEWTEINSEEDEEENE